MSDLPADPEVEDSASRIVSPQGCRVAGRETENRKEAKTMTQGKERTKEELYREAKRLNITGRSKMNKGALKAALARRGH